MNVTHYPELDEAVFRCTLENGLSIAVVPKKGFQKKVAYFVTDFGSIHTEFTLEGRHCTAPAGVAHYLEHKLFDMPGGRDISEEFARLGATTNAFTGYDMTAYFFSCTRNFEECLRLLLEFVSTPYFTDESVEKERGIIDQEIGMNADTPDSVIFEDLATAMYSTHPIRVPILGTGETIRQITPQVLYTCHRAFYTPDNMLLCVVGDVDPEAVAAIAREVLPETRLPAAQKERAWAEAPTCPRREITRRMDVAMPMFNLGFKCPPVGRGVEAIRREIVADLACEALFGESSQLYLRLYEEGLIDSSFGGGFETVDGASMLLCSGDSNDPQALQAKLLERAGALCREGIPADRFARMKRSALGRRIRDLDSFDSTCYRICAYHFGDFDYFRFPEIYRQIEAQELLDFLSQVIRPDNHCLATIYPSAQQER